jgi:hypothetical protein
VSIVSTLLVKVPCPVGRSAGLPLRLQRGLYCRALADQLEGSEAGHAKIREAIVEYMEVVARVLHA